MKPRSAGKPARRRSAGAVPERLLSAALRGLGEGAAVFECRPDGALCIAFANARLCSMVGYSERELAGSCHNLFHTDAAALQRLRDWIRGGMAAEIFSDEGDLVGKDGRSLFASWTFCPLAMKGSRRRYVVGTYRDITEKRHLEEALMHAQRLDAVGRMAGGVAHDFNNLISVINGYCQLLTSKAGNREDFVRDLGEILRAGQKAAALTRQLLALGRRQPMAPRVLDLNALVAENRDILARVLGDEGVLELALHPRPLLVRADPDQLQQVLLNLTLNARDALRTKGRVGIATSLRVLDDSKARGRDALAPGRYALLEFADNGMGMDADTLAHLFEPFFTTKGPDRGSGLGLALAYGVVKQSGGNIAVHSTLLVGSTFEIYLPLVDDERSTAAPSGATSLKSFNTRGRESILLVEDDGIVAKMVSGMLASEGYGVVMAADVDEAVGKCAQQRDGFDVLIAAIGESAACARLVRRLREKKPGIKVLCTHGCGGVCHVAESQPACQACLPKPFAMSELLRAVRELIDR